MDNRNPTRPDEEGAAPVPAVLRRKMAELLDEGLQLAQAAVAFKRNYKHLNAAAEVLYPGADGTLDERDLAWEAWGKATGVDVLHDLAVWINDTLETGSRYGDSCPKPPLARLHHDVKATIAALTDDAVEVTA